MVTYHALFWCALRGFMFEYDRLLKWFGVHRNITSHGEKLISALGAGIGLFVVSGVSELLYSFGMLDVYGSCLIVASMGASAVLLFAVPHGALSQPWALIGGHIISACIGVTMYRFLGEGVAASALAVGLSVGAMYYAKCIHPPGGATALTAVIGGDVVQSLGYLYVFVPILLNVFCILVVAVGFNYVFRWRRYPAHLHYKSVGVGAGMPSSLREFELTQEDFSAAIQKHDSFVDITEEGLTDLLELAKQHAELNITHPATITLGKYYSNGKLGRMWSVRQVLDATGEQEGSTKCQVIYKNVAGYQSYDTGICLQDEFRRWARFEVVQKNNRWVKAI